MCAPTQSLQGSGLEVSTAEIRCFSLQENSDRLDALAEMELDTKSLFVGDDQGRPASTEFAQ